MNTYPPIAVISPARDTVKASMFIAYILALTSCASYISVIMLDYVVLLLP